ncbi:hypothetical protein [Halorubrum sp. CBA1125]|uniref:hypothetical protein n=1 Tax=Halorubrum sp. CBA1125 TaxID=2668072 RepID=UPI002AA2B48B|nr:hypothetical protein [Halorubrum sp. CBA1125]
MVSTTAVKRALAALATRTDTARRPSAGVIDEADAARADVRRAAGFVDAVGLDRLEEAIAAADRNGDATAADRGREALDDYRRLREAASADGPGETHDGPGETQTGAAVDAASPVPGTPKSDTNQGTGR